MIETGNGFRCHTGNSGYFDQKTEMELRKAEIEFSAKVCTSMI
jgi:hypothetical protein